MKVLKAKVTIYRTIAGTFEIEVPEGKEEEEQAIRSLLQEAPDSKFNVITDDFAEIEIEGEIGKRCISLSTFREV